jgi:hypothetical protein
MISGESGRRTTIHRNSYEEFAVSEEQGLFYHEEHRLPETVVRNT